MPSGEGPFESLQNNIRTVINNFAPMFFSTFNNYPEWYNDTVEPSRTARMYPYRWRQKQDNNNRLRLSFRTAGFNHPSRQNDIESQKNNTIQRPGMLL